VAIFIADVDHADIMNPILREKGIRSLLGTPLVVEGDLIGVLHVGSLTPRRFDTQDLSVLQIAAARAGPGIERARLFSALEHEHDVAMVLQRSLLPRRLAEVIGISTAVRYLPASDEVGGDWYDVFELPRGRLGVVIGDVVGHGVRAAALMGQLRTALHAYALRDDGPGRVLEQVDRFMQSMPDDAMATAAYAVLDPDRGELALASAGHLPPIVLGGGEARLIEISPAPPLGAMPFGKCPEQNLPLAAGETLVLYTDGLIERRAVPLTDSMAQLLDVVRDATSAEEVCQLAFEELVPAEGVRDDVALVAVRNEEIPTELRLRLPAEARILADMRRALRRWLRHRADAGEQDIVEVTMAVNEACANAIEHAYTPMPAEFELCASFADGEVAVVISDAGHWRSPRGVHRGRGLTIMETAMDGVEVEAGPAGTRVALRRRMRR
jgi:anti-sigma regulatory factor (Ser/Thr protein kinase)